MPRPSKPQTKLVQVCCLLPPSQARKVVALAERDDRSDAYISRQAVGLAFFIVEHLEQLKRFSDDPIMREVLARARELYIEDTASQPQEEEPRELQPAGTGHILAVTDPILSSY